MLFELVTGERQKWLEYAREKVVNAHAFYQLSLNELKKKKNI